MVRHHVRPRGRRGLLYTARRGSATIWAAVSITGLLAAGALVVDGALLYNARSDLQAAADSAALAGASALTIDPAEVRSRAASFAAKNTAGGDDVAVEPGDIELGDWDYETSTFTPLAGADEHEADAVRVTTRLAEARGNPVRLAFAAIFDPEAGDARAQATAVYRPREIVLVLDLSGSMSYDSRVRAFEYLPEQDVIDNFHLMWTQLGSPTYGGIGFESIHINSGNRNTVREQLDLDDVPYPYPSGSWNDYIDYVMNDNTLNRNGYRRHYGMITLVDYWMARRMRAHQTPDLHLTAQQPLTAVKDAVDVFIDVLEEEETDDRLGLAVYTASDGTAKLEQTLTHDFDIVRTISRQRQAGHYDSMTNISAGMNVATRELVENARPGTHRTMIVLTDGVANRPGDNGQATQACIDEAYDAAGYSIPILTISLGTNAQTSLMQDVADITDGIHFNVPGGSRIADYEADLREVFRRIAVERPLRLVD